MFDYVCNQKIFSVFDNVSHTHTEPLLGPLSTGFLLLCSLCQSSVQSTLLKSLVCLAVCVCMCFCVCVSETLCLFPSVWPTLSVSKALLKSALALRKKRRKRGARGVGSLHTPTNHILKIQLGPFNNQVVASVFSSIRTAK